MGEAKRRKAQDSTFGFLPKVVKLQQDRLQTKPELFTVFSECDKMSNDETLVYLIANSNTLFGIFGDYSAEIRNQMKTTYSAQPKLYIAWLEAIVFAELINRSRISISRATVYWVAYWSQFIKIIGAINIKERDEQLTFLLLRLNGLWQYILQSLSHNFNKESVKIFGRFMRQTNPLFDMGDVSIQVGLLFQLHPQNIYYHGENLLVYRGGDGSDESGELMVAVKHSSGCWNHYSNPDNHKVKLSEYKQAKARLQSLNTPLKGELIHPQSSKLAKLLGLNVTGNYAYLNKN